MDGNFVQKEKFEGPFSPEGGVIVSFNRLWGANDHWEGHRFTDEECEKLLAGENLCFSAVSKKGIEYEARGRLMAGSYSGHDFYGFTLCNDILPSSYCGHTFTEDEMAMLEAGQGVFAEDFMSKKKNVPFSATVYWQDKTDGRGKELKMVFPKRD